MPEWLTEAVQHSEHAIDLSTLAIRIALAFVFGCAAAAIHHLTSARSKPGEEQTLATTLVLLSVLIAVVTMVIGSNIARAFSLVGALGIIRFRTVVEDTRDTAFVIYAVACGMGAGTGYAVGPAMVTPLVLLVAWVLRPRPVLEQPKLEGILVLRLSAGHPPNDRLQEVLRQHTGENGRPIGVTTARGGSAFDATYAVRLPPPDLVYAMVSELSRIEGVQGVEFKED